MIWPSGSANQVPEAALAFLIKKKGRNLLKINPKIPIYSLLKIFVKGLFLGIANATWSGKSGSFAMESRHCLVAL